MASEQRVAGFFCPTGCLPGATILLSAFAVTSPEPASLYVRRPMPAAVADLVLRPWTEHQNVSFPTVNGQSELLDVYTPDTPAPAGGYPVMVAIHGGGWRRFDKTAFGLRTAKVFARDGYVVVAPNYVLSEPGNPTWPVNFEDVQAAVRWVRGNAEHAGYQPERDRRRGRIGRGQSGRACSGRIRPSEPGRRRLRGGRRRRRGFDPDRSDDALQREPASPASRPRSFWAALPSKFPPTTSRPRRSIMFRPVTRRCS